MSMILNLFFALLFSGTENVPVWKDGYLEIHHINTGSGNAAFFIFPDGTTLLFDAGEVNRASSRPTHLKTSPPLPNDTISAGKCIVNYIQQVLPGITHLDYAVVSHFHPDHYGSINKHSPHSNKGDWYISGITEVNEYLPIRHLIDRNFPTYDFPVDIKSHTFDKETFLNYLRFVDELKKNGKVESLLPGSNSQIKPLYKKTGEFSVQNICANGVAWIGKGIRTKQIIPGNLSAKDYNENPLSIAVKINYGDFDYFTGGDLTGSSNYGLPAWFDMESEIAEAVGEVDAFSLNHHGVRDATNEKFLRALSPSVIIQQSWSSNHPGEEVLHRMISPLLTPKPEIFATYVHAETKATYGFWLVDNYRSQRGHVAIQVSPGGNDFSVTILDDSKLQLEVLKKFGPYKSK